MLVALEGQKNIKCAQLWPRSPIYIIYIANFPTMTMMMGICQLGQSMIPLLSKSARETEGWSLRSERNSNISFHSHPSEWTRLPRTRSRIDAKVSQGQGMYHMVWGLNIFIYNFNVKSVLYFYERRWLHTTSFTGERLIDFLFMGKIFEKPFITEYSTRKVLLPKFINQAV